MNTEFGQQDDETLVYEERVSCDGGKYGHPKIFLSVNKNEITVCPVSYTHLTLPTNSSV